MTKTEYEIVTLPPSQWKEYRDLRLRALTEEPQAFASNYTENALKPDIFWQERLDPVLEHETPWLLFAKKGDKLVGMVGAYTKEEKDTVEIIAVYVVPEERGKGVAKKLMETIIKRIKNNSEIHKILLGLNAQQTSALNLYKKLGFLVVSEEEIIFGDGKKHPYFEMTRRI